MHFLQTLLDIDSSRVASLLLTMPRLTPLLSEVVEELRSDDQHLYSALHALFTYRSVVVCIFVALRNLNANRCVSNSRE